MTSHLFSSFRDASSFAKRSMLESKGGVRLRRSENGFVVEVAEAHSKPQELNPTSTPCQTIGSHSANIIDELREIMLEVELERSKAEKKRSKAEKKLCNMCRLPIHPDIIKNNPSAILCERCQLACDESRDKRSELNCSGNSSKNKLCPICGYTLVQNSSSSHFCKCQRRPN